MYCSHCGAKNEEGANFCTSCGKSMQHGVGSNSTHHESVASVTTASTTSVDESKLLKNPIIKCGNCGYIGHAAKARNPFISALAWVCVVFAPIITIIYFFGTHKYECPKCNSTFVSIKDADGNYKGQKGGAARVIGIIVACLFAVAIIGILSAVVLASLNTAREKGAAAAAAAQEQSSGSDGN